MKKGVWRYEISWFFPIHYKLSKKSKKIVFSVFLHDLEHCAPSPHSSYIQKPSTIRVKSFCVASIRAKVMIIRRSYLWLSFCPFPFFSHVFSQKQYSYDNTIDYFGFRGLKESIRIVFGIELIFSLPGLTGEPECDCELIFHLSHSLRCVYPWNKKHLIIY